MPGAWEVSSLGEALSGGAFQLVLALHRRQIDMPPRAGRKQPSSAPHSGHLSHSPRLMSVTPDPEECPVGGLRRPPNHLRHDGLAVLRSGVHDRQCTRTDSPMSIWTAWLTTVLLEVLRRLDDDQSALRVDPDDRDHRRRRLS